MFKKNIMLGFICTILSILYSSEMYAKKVDETQSLGAVVGVQKKPVILNIATGKNNRILMSTIGYQTSGHFPNARKAKEKIYAYGMQNITQISLVDPFHHKSSHKVKNKKGILNVSIGIAGTVIRNQPSSTKYILA